KSDSTGKNCRQRKQCNSSAGTLSKGARFLRRDWTQNRSGRYTSRTRFVLCKKSRFRTGPGKTKTGAGNLRRHRQPFGSRKKQSIYGFGSAQHGPISGSRCFFKRVDRNIARNRTAGLFVASALSGSSCIEPGRQHTKFDGSIER